MLTQFYKEMQAWVDAGCTGHPNLSPRHGLCNNLRAYVWVNRGSASRVELHDRYDKLSQEMRDQFVAEDLDPDFPFNKNTSYQVESENALCYTNKQRLDWIKQHANPIL